MNMYKGLFLAAVCSVTALNGSQSFQAGAMWRDGKPPVRACFHTALASTLLKNDAQSYALNSGGLNRASLYSAQHCNLKEGDKLLSFENIKTRKSKGAVENDVRLACKSFAYLMVDQKVHKKVSNSETINNMLQDLSPENQERVKNGVTFLGSSLAVSSAEAAYDYQVHGKSLQESAQQYAVNTGHIAARYVVYNGVIKPIVQGQLDPVGEVLVEAAAGYATAYVIGEGFKLASRYMNG